MKRTVEIPHDPVDARQFELAVKQLADSLFFGPEDSIFHGSGLEYSQSRVYEPGDSVKLIDWKVSARTGKYFVKEYQELRQKLKKDEKSSVVGLYHIAFDLPKESDSTNWLPKNFKIYLCMS